MDGNAANVNESNQKRYFFKKDRKNNECLCSNAMCVTVITIRVFCEIFAKVIKIQGVKESP